MVTGGAPVDRGELVERHLEGEGGLEGGGETAFLELAVLWEPHHPILQTVDERPDDMTQELHMVETWKWFEGEWYFVENERHSDFMKEHPGILEKGTSLPGAPEKG